MEDISRVIQLSDYTQENLNFKCPEAKEMVVKVDSDCKLIIYGHNILSESYYILPILDSTNYDVISEINKPGEYNINVKEVDIVRFELVGDKGQINVIIYGNKEMGAENINERF